MTGARLTVRPLTPDTWPDFETVMGPTGGARGCWCMHWRLSTEEWMAGKGDGNRAAMRRLTDGGTSPGVVAYRDGRPVAWCGFGDRSSYPRMQRSSLVAPVDDEPVVSLTCLLVRRDQRGKGWSTDLIDAVCDHLAETTEARIVEAYPVDPPEGRRAGPDTAMTGIASAFRAAGSTEVTRRRGDRPVMRYELP